MPRSSGCESVSPRRQRSFSNSYSALAVLVAAQASRRSRAATGPHQRGARRSACGRPAPDRDCPQGPPAPASRTASAAHPRPRRDRRARRRGRSRGRGSGRVRLPRRSCGSRRPRRARWRSPTSAQARPSSGATRHAARASTAATRAATPAATARCRSTRAPHREDRSVTGRTVRKTERLSSDSQTGFVPR